MSLVLHAAAISTLLGPPDRPHAPIVLVDLVGSGWMALPEEAAVAGSDSADEGTAYAPALGTTQPAADAQAPEDGVTAMAPEADPHASPVEIGSPLDVESAEAEDGATAVAARAEEATSTDADPTTRMAEEVAALMAENFRLESELSEERERAALLARALAERREAEATARRELQQAHDALVAALREEIAAKDIALRRAREGLTVSIVDRVLFPSGQATLTAEGREIIDAVGRVLAMATPPRVIIEGHTDDVPIGPELRARFPTNWELSTARATEVVRQLVERGLPPLKLEAVGRADTRPVADNASEEGRRRNRRIEIIVSRTDTGG